MSSRGDVTVVRDDGGRQAAGFGTQPSRRLPGLPGSDSPANDCVCRSISIATAIPYGEVHAALGQLAGDPDAPSRGVSLGVGASYLMRLGWEFTLNRFEHARGRVTHRTLRELAARGGRYVLEFRAPAQGFGHVSALADGELRDIDGSMSLEELATKPVYGWWTKVAGTRSPKPPPDQYFDMSHVFVPRGDRQAHTSAAPQGSHRARGCDRHA